MAFEIPYAASLAGELSKRTNKKLELRESFCREDRWQVITDSEDRKTQLFPARLTTSQLWNDGNVLGELTSIVYFLGGCTRVGMLSYTGRLPNDRMFCMSEEFHLFCTEYENIDQLWLPKFPALDLSRANNTAAEPLYRHDVQDLRFADFEADGTGRAESRADGKSKAQLSTTTKK